VSEGGRSSALRGTAFRLMIAITTVGFGGYSLLLPVVPLWVARGGSGAFGAGASTGMFMLFTVLTQPLVPSLLRRVGHRWVMGTGLVLMGIPAPLLALSAALPSVLPLAALRGVGFGLVTVCGGALLAELVPPSEHGRASARYGLAVGVPQLVLLPVGVGIVDRFGFPWVLAAGASPLLGALLVPFLRTRASGPRTAQPRAADVGVDPIEDTATRSSRWPRGTAGPTLAMLSCAVAQGGLVTFLPLVGTGVSAAAALFGTAVGAVLGRLVAGELADRRQQTGRVLGAGVLVTLLGMVAEVAAAGTPGPGLLAAGTLVIGAVLVGVGFGVVQNDSMVVLFATAGPGRYGAASALWNIAYDAGTGVGAVGLGAVAEPFGFPAAFGTAALFLLFALATALLPRRRPPATPHPDQPPGAG
jgi:MFS family permease